MSLGIYLRDKSSAIINRFFWCSAFALSPLAWARFIGDSNFWPYFTQAASANEIQDQVSTIPGGGSIYQEAQGINEINAQAAIVESSRGGPFFPEERYDSVGSIGERLPEEFKYVQDLPADNSYADIFNSYTSSVREAASELYIHDYLMTASPNGIIGAENYGIGQMIYGQNFEALATGVGLELGFMFMLGWQGFRALRNFSERDFNWVAKSTSVGAVALFAAAIAIAPAIPLFAASEGFSPLVVKLATIGAIGLKVAAAIGCHKAISHGKKGASARMAEEYGH